MINDKFYRNVAISLVFAILVVLSYFILKPLLIAIIVGIILAFIFLPLYKWLYKELKKKDLSAFLVCIFLLVIIILPLWYLTPVVIDQSIKLFTQVQQIDFGQVIQNLFPNLSQSETLTKDILPSTGSFVTSATNYFLESISNFILNIPTVFFQLVVLFFTFYFTLRDNEKLTSYIKSLIPFSNNIQEKLFKSSRDITISVIYGRILMGIAQGLIVGVGFFVLKVPNALLLTALSALAGILPIVGTIIVWLPVSIFLFASGDSLIALGLIGFGILATIFESVVQPVLLARMVKMNSSIMLVGMIGGLFMFGILGVILGPLILAYLLIVLEIYRDKRAPGILKENK